MLSFNLPLSQIKQIMSKYLKTSKMIPSFMAKDIMMRLALEEKKEQEAKLKNNLQVKDDLFDESTQER